MAPSTRLVAPLLAFACGVLLSADPAWAGEESPAVSESEWRARFEQGTDPQQAEALRALGVRRTLELETLRVVVVHFPTLEKEASVAAKALLTRSWALVRQIVEPMLVSDNPAEREASLWAIAAVGAPARPLLAAVVPSLAAQEVAVANAASAALESIGPAHAEDLGPLVTAMGASPAPARRFFADQLVRAAEAGAQLGLFAPRIVESLGTPDSTPTKLAFMSLLSSMSDARDDTPIARVVTRCASDQEPLVRAKAAGVVARYLPRKWARELLESLLNDADESVRGASAGSWIESRPGPGGGSRIVEALSSARSAEARESVVLSLWSLGATLAPGERQALAGTGLASESLVTRAAAVVVLLRSGEGLKVDSLLPLQVTASGLARELVAEACGWWSASDPLVIPMMTSLLADADSAVRHVALQTLRRWEAISEQWAEKVMKLMGDPEWAVRLAAAEIAVQRDIAPVAGRSLLLQGLQHSRPEVRVEAARGLGRLGAKVKGAKEALERAMMNATDFERADLARALEAVSRAR